MDYIYLTIACLVGAAISGILGWLKDGTDWNTKKFMQTILSGMGAAIVYAISYVFDTNGLSIRDILIAIAFGAGVDNIVNRTVGAIKNA